MKLALGTVQFGLDYGVTNLSGQVTIDEVRNILTFAKNNKIDTLDTASGYGNSEEVLGEIGVDNYQIITKTISLEGDVNKVIDSFHKSLESLGQKQVEGLLVHDINNVENKQFDILFSKLNELKQQGLIKKIGFSTYTPGQVNFLLENFGFDLIQVPFNVFDTRLIQGGQLQALKSKGIEVHARSIFLQGLLLMNLDDVPMYFSKIYGSLRDFKISAREMLMSDIEFAINFVRNVKHVDKMIIGVNTVEQLNEIIKTPNIKLKSSKFCDIAVHDDNYVNPSNWNL